MSDARSITRLLPVVAIVSGIALLPGCATTFAVTSDAQVRQGNEVSRTAADHEAVAAWYEAQARAARSTAQEHRWQALTAQLHQLGTLDYARGRCAAIAKELKAAAAEYDRRAAHQHALATAARARPPAP